MIKFEILLVIISAFVIAMTILTFAWLESVFSSIFESDKNNMFYKTAHFLGILSLTIVIVYVLIRIYQQLKEDEAS
jgi:multisubunit Na+/H+ antiporter MnhG subunit